jgi:hypothetical protein
MATASIIIEQAGNAQPIGVAGRSRDDLDLTPVVMRNADDTDVFAWRWTMLDRPAGSTAVLTSPTSPSVSFTPDVAGGTWRVGLQVNTATIAETTTALAAVQDDFGRRRPAAGEVGPEANWLDGGSPNSRGWATDTNDILSAIDPVDLTSPALVDFTLTVGASVGGLTRGGLGLPDNMADLVATDFIDLNAPFGPPNGGPAPVINSVAFVSLPGPGYSLCVLAYDLDTSASIVGDKWQVVITRANPGKRFLFAGIEIV